MRYRLLQRAQTVFAGAHPDHVLDRNRPDLAVADPSGLRCLENDRHHVGCVDVVHDHLHPHLRDEVDRVFRASVDLAVAALAPVPARLADRHTGDAEGLQGLLDLIELEGLDDRGDQSHDDAPCLVDVAAEEAGAVVCDPNSAAPACEKPPPPREPRSYDVSACSSMSMPDTSASRSMRKPSVLCSASPIRPVITKE